MKHLLLDSCQLSFQSAAALQLVSPEELKEH